MAVGSDYDGVLPHDLTTLKEERAPSEFWPSGGVIVVAKDGNTELGFLVTQDAFRNRVYDSGGNFQKAVECLVTSVWQKEHLEPKDAENVPSIQ